MANVARQLLISCNQTKPNQHRALSKRPTHMDTTNLEPLHHRPAQLILRLLFLGLSSGKHRPPCGRLRLAIRQHTVRRVPQQPLRVGTQHVIVVFVAAQEVERVIRDHLLVVVHDLKARAGAGALCRVEKLLLNRGP